jgi:hypothetical protein
MNYISIREILDNILDNPLLKDISLERVVNYAQRFIRRIGMPKEFIEKTEIINIEDWRGQLPCDYYQMIQVRSAYTKNTINEHPIYYRYSTDNFHMSNHKTNEFKDPTYKIQGKIIFTSTKETPIEIAYRAIKVDEEGYPMIPDNSTFAEALEAYIKVKVYTNLFDQNKINNAVLQNAQQEYCWAVGAAQTELVMPSIDEMESLANLWNQILIRTTEHKHGFKTEGTKEHWRTH